MWMQLTMTSTLLVTCIAISILSSGGAQPSIKLVVYPSIVSEGGHPSLICQLTGSPLPQVTQWLKDGTPLQASAKYTITSQNRILQISSATTEDQGEYECRAKAGSLHLNSSARVHVLVPPVIHNSSNVTVVEGENATLSCQATNHFFIRWLKEGQYVDNRSRFQSLGYGEELLISNATENDRGDYTCHVFNQKFRVKETVHLTVLVPPRLLSSPQDTYTAARQRVSFPCFGVGKPEPTSVWFHNGEAVALEGRPGVEIELERMTFSSVSKADEGFYQCSLINEAGMVMSPKAKLKVLDMSQPEPLETTLNGRYGAKMVLPLPNLKVPFLDIQWQIDGARINYSLTPRFLKTAMNELMVANLTYGDEKLVFAAVVRENDSRISLIEIFKLAVEEPLGVPTDVTARATSYDKIVVTWTPSFYLKGIREYFVSIQSNDGWESREKVDINSTSCNFSGLFDGLVYRVKLEVVLLDSERLPAREFEVSTPDKPKPNDHLYTSTSKADTTVSLAIFSTPSGTPQPNGGVGFSKGEVAGIVVGCLVIVFC